jgi:PilZ domain
LSGAVLQYTGLSVLKACTVLIASADVLPTLKERTTSSDAELIAFTDAEALRALEAITNRKPALVALDRVFAGTPRGAALINRIKADPNLKQSEILVISPDSDFSRFRSHPPSTGQGGRGTGAAVAAPAAAPAAAPTQPLDQRGTRRAPRYKIAGQVDVLIDGNPAALIDISTVGAQVVSAAVLKPNQRLRMSLNDQAGDVRFKASVAWASFEISSKGPRYRAGIQFIDANVHHVDAYIARHKA